MNTNDMDNSSLNEKERFSIVKRAESFTHAWRGIGVFLKGTHNAWVHIGVMACVVLLGFYLDITSTEWIAIVLSCGLVLAAEAFNTALEIDIDLTSPDYHPYARDTKDVAAAAVLISAITAAIVGVIVFAPYLI